jgi:hypothetical protein
MEANFKKSSMLKTFVIAPLRLLFKSVCVRNAQPLVTAIDGKTYAIVDGLVVPQGPNYALAKRL